MHGSATVAPRGGGMLLNTSPSVNYSHLTYFKRGDLPVNAQSTAFQILSSGNVPRSLFIIDIHLTAMVKAQGRWSGHFNPQTESYVNNLLDPKETAKIVIYATHYENIGFGFVPFAASCFGVNQKSTYNIIGSCFKKGKTI
jgi:hypothetical protein